MAMVQGSGGTATTSLVETVNINVDDFSETFLTCSTCLYTYDQEERKPKLLPCSHSVCLFCLTQLANLATDTDPLSLKCPLCREVCILPPGGVNAFPVAFFINQLLDVMQKQRKDVVPSCTNHPTDQLLYCETCDLVFCEQCQNSVVNKKCTEHTVIPLSIAIKRMSEIVVYRAKGRLRALDDARVTVNGEIDQLDTNADKMVEQINAAIQEVSNLVEQRRRELIEAVRVRRDQKRKVLKDQIEAILDEKKKLQKELESSQLDIRSMARQLKDKVSEENWNNRLIQPRENAFLKINTSANEMLAGVEKHLSDFGTIHASSTFPGNSMIEVNEHLSLYVENCVKLHTRDVSNINRTSGGDPIEAELIHFALPPPQTKEEKIKRDAMPEFQSTKQPVKVKDNEDGTYDLDFSVSEPGEYELTVTIFGRPVQNSPLALEVTELHKPFWQLPVELCKPTKIQLDEDGTFYVLDSGSKRVRVVKKNGDVIADLVNDAMRGGTAVGMTLLPNKQIAILNWETRTLSRINMKNEIVEAVQFSEFHQPLDLCRDPRGRLIIGDTYKVFVFNPDMKPLFSFPVNSKDGGMVKCVGNGLDGDIFVGTNTELLLFDSSGKKLRSLDVFPDHFRTRRCPTGKFSVHSVGMCPQSGLLIAVINNRLTNHISISVCNYKGNHLYSIDAAGTERFIGPTGLVLSPPGYKAGTCFIADHNRNSVRMFKYK